MRTTDRQLRCQNHDREGPHAPLARSDPRSVCSVAACPSTIVATEDGATPSAVSRYRSTGAALEARVPVGSHVLCPVMRHRNVLDARPVGPGMRLAESSDGRSWHDLVLPFPGKPFAGDNRLSAWGRPQS